MIPIEECLKQMHELCPSYFTRADVEVYLAEECLKLAIKEQNPATCQEYLDEAISKLLKNSASAILPRTVTLLK